MSTTFGKLSSAVAVLLIALAAPALAAPVIKRPPGPPPDPTLHVYRELTDGGIQAVLADDIVSSAGVAAIQASLRKQASAYAKGAYPNPDGKTRAVVVLRAAGKRISITYSDVRRGGEIRFRTRDPALVAALHDWMAATVRVNQKLHHDGGPGIDSPGRG